VFWDISIDTGYALLHRSSGLPIDESQSPKLTAARIGKEGLFAVVGENRHRMSVLFSPGTATDGPLIVAIPVGSDAQRWLISAMRFLALLRGKPSPDLRITPQRRSRLRQMLRVFDARTCGASHRDIASVLFGEHRISRPDWHESSLRYATIRLIRDGNALVDRGHRALLKHRGSG
jgi:hypothetical protein